MPNYSYACTECGHAFDIYQAFSDNALTECPQCQGVLRKKFSAVGVVFKGSGFYRNDARGSSSTTESGAAKDSSKNGDSKPATTTTESSSNGKTADGGSSSSSGSDSGKSTTAKKTPAKAGASA